jgi:hypothetical protein
MLWNGNESGGEKKTKAIRISKQPSLVHIMTDQKQLDNVECFNYLCTMITNYARCKHDTTFRIDTAKAALSKNTALFISKLHLNLRKN